MVAWILKCLQSTCSEGREAQEMWRPNHVHTLWGLETTAVDLKVMFKFKIFTVGLKATLHKYPSCTGSSLTRFTEPFVFSSLVIINSF